MISRALVLGGGGPTGFAWQWGVLCELYDAGVDFSRADLVVGTSGGASAALELMDRGNPHGLMDTMMEVPSQSVVRANRDDGPDFTQMLRQLISESQDGAEIRAGLARYARAADTVSQDDYKKSVMYWMSMTDWPDAPIVLTAVDLDSGRLTTFDRDSGVSMADALSASCSVPGMAPPVTINGRDYYDGTVNSPINAELAAGYDRVLVLAPIAEIRGLPGAGLAEQIAPIEAAGQVRVVKPDQATREAMGRDVMATSRRPAITRAGLAQGASIAAELAEFWSAG